jgi:hypothetical protein
MQTPGLHALVSERICLITLFDRKHYSSTSGRFAKRFGGENLRYRIAHALLQNSV